MTAAIRLHSASIRIGVAAFALIASGSLAALAADPAELFQKGRKLIEAGEFQAALADLRTSYSALPSPNTLLLIAHAERGIGHRVTAVHNYEQVVREADARVKKGETRYAVTAADARQRLEELTAELARIELRVRHAPPDAKIKIQLLEAPSRLDAEGTAVVARMWVEPGQVPIHIDASKGPYDAALTIAAGHLELVDVDYNAPVGSRPVVQSSPEPAHVASPPASSSPSPSSEPPAATSSRAIPLGSWIAGGVGVAGLATFAVLGTISNGSYNDLSACSPRCPDSERSKADTARHEQTIANVGLVVGGLGVATAVAFYFLAPRSSSPASPSVGLSVGPTQALLHGAF